MGPQPQSRESLLRDFVSWCSANITGDEKGQAQIFVDHLDAMNTDTPRTGGRYKSFRYFNGGIFAQPL